MAPAVNWTYRARLVRIVDGDTLVLDVDTGFATRREERVRLLGVDTPEIVGSRRADGLDAKRALATRLFGRELLVVTQMEKVDGFRRYLATVYADGEDINQWLLDEGLATVWRRG